MEGMKDNIHSAGEKKSGLYPRVISLRTVFLGELIESASYRTTLSKQEMRMAFELVKRLTFRMSNAFLKRLGRVEFMRVPPTFFKNKRNKKE